MFINNLSWKTVLGFMLAVWAISFMLWGSPAEAANLKLTAKTERPYTDLRYPPKNKNWGCGVGRPVAKTKSGKLFCPR
jgi:hypothetical protein